MPSYVADMCSIATCPLNVGGFLGLVQPSLCWDLVYWGVERHRDEPKAVFYEKGASHKELNLNGDASIENENVITQDHLQQGDNGALRNPLFIL